MYERTYGYRYGEPAEYASAAEIAKRIRADIKEAKAEGLLPTRWSYSVRSSNYSGGCSIDVTVRNAPDAWQDCDGFAPLSKFTTPEGWTTGRPCGNVWCKAHNDPAYAHGAETHRVLTDEAAAAKMTLERIHNAYNHDGSDAMVDYFDVRYYGTVAFDWLDR